MQSISTLSNILNRDQSVIFINGAVIHKIRKTEEGEFEFDLYKNLHVNTIQAATLIERNEVSPFQEGVFTIMDGTLKEIISEVIALGRAS